jgi:hypothetical protein
MIKTGCERDRPSRASARLPTIIRGALTFTVIGLAALAALRVVEKLGGVLVHLRNGGLVAGSSGKLDHRVREYVGAALECGGFDHKL